MPEYVVTDPQSGRKVRLRGDSPPTEAELEQIFSSLPQSEQNDFVGPEQRQQSAEPNQVTGSNRFFSGEMFNDFMGTPEELRPEVKSRAGFGQRMAGGEAARLAAGAAEPLVGAVQIGAMGVDAIRERMGQDSNFARAIGEQWERLKNYQSEGRQDPEAFDGARLAGNIASGAGAASRIPQATSIAGRVLQGAGIGGALSATQPSLSDNPVAETASQATVGALTGAAVPLVGALGKMAYDRLVPGGIERSAARLANQAAGPRRDEVIRALREADDGIRQGTVRPNITAGEAAAPAGSTEFSALQRTAFSRQDPSQGLGIDRAASRMREGQLRAIGGTPESLRAAQDRVSKQVGELYRDAFSQPFTVTPALRESLKNPFVRQAQGAVLRTAQSEGIKRGTPEYMHLVKKSLDDIISAPAVEGGLRPTQQRAAARARDQFLQTFEDALPAYGQARRQAAELYRPLSQMQVAQNLEQRLSAPLVDQGAGTAGQRAASFAQGLRDAPSTIRRATGFRGNQSLEDIMRPEQMEVISRVGKDLANRADFDELAKAGQQAVNKMIGTQFSSQVAPLLNRTMMLINKVMSRTAQGASDRGLKVLVEKMQNPAEMARIMEAATQAEKAQLNALLNSVISGGAGRSVTSGFQTADDFMDRTESARNSNELSDLVR